MTAARIVGQAYADQIEQLSLELYQTANAYAAERGIIIADTKFEFGLDESTTPAAVVLIDEVLTPDSSRFWSADRYEIGRGQESYDKQYLRGKPLKNSPSPADRDGRLAGEEWSEGKRKSGDAG